MLELIGLLVGVAAGILVPWSIPSQYSLYVAAGLLAALDSALGGYCARIKEEFHLSVFLSGTVFPSSPTVVSVTICMAAP